MRKIEAVQNAACQCLVLFLAVAWVACGGVATAAGAEMSGWESSDIGEVPAAGTLAMEGGSLALTGAGRMAPWGKDALFFAYRETKGDFSLQARVDLLEGPTDQAAAILMARDGLDPEAPFAAIVLRKKHGLVMVWREFAGMALVEKRIWGPVPPLWIRLERTGKDFRTFSSTDGADWKEFHAEELNLPDTIQVGLGVLSNHASESASTVFDQIEISTR